MNTSCSEELKLLWPFYFDVLFAGIFSAIALPVMILYFQDMGFSFFGISTIFAIPMIATLIFEIPTGAIADIYGRKFSVLLGMTFEAVLFMSVPFFRGVSVLILIFFFSKIAGTFVSGADTAWVVDLLKHNKKSSFLQNYYSKYLMFAGIGIVIGGFLSSLVVSMWGIPSVWIVAGAGELVMVFVLLVFAKEHFVKRKSRVTDSIKKSINYAKKGFSYISKHPVLFYFMVEAVIWSFAGIWGVAMQPFFRELGLKNEYFGILYAVTGAIAIIAPLASNKMMEFFKSEKLAFICAQLIQTLVFAIMIAVTNLYFAIILYLLSHPFGMAVGPISQRFKQQFIPSKQRATITSIFSAIVIPGGMFGLLTGGKLMDLFGPRFSLFIIVFSGIGSIILYSLMKPEKAKIHI